MWRSASESCSARPRSSSSRRASRRWSTRLQPHPARVGGHPRLAAGRPHRRREPQPHRLRRERHHAVPWVLGSQHFVRDAVAGGRWRGQRRGPPPRTGAPGPGRGRRRSAGSPPAPGRCVPRPGSARRASRAQGSSTGLSPARGARRGSRRAARPRSDLRTRPPQGYTLCSPPRRRWRDGHAQPCSASNASRPGRMSPTSGTSWWSGPPAFKQGA